MFVCEAERKAALQGGLPSRLERAYMPDLTAAFSWLPDENFGTRVAAI
jgi:hypothetical protein